MFKYVKLDANRNITAYRDQPLGDQFTLIGIPKKWEGAFYDTWREWWVDSEGNVRRDKHD